MYLPIVGLVFGMAAGFLFPAVIPAADAKLLSVAVAAAFDAVVSGLKAAAFGKFNDGVFAGNFFFGVTAAVFFVYVGNILSVDVYYVALLALGLRIFNNLSLLRQRMVPVFASARNGFGREGEETERHEG